MESVTEEGVLIREQGIVPTGWTSVLLLEPRLRERERREGEEREGGERGRGSELLSGIFVHTMKHCYMRLHYTHY